jgi:hypothetical protein
MTSTSKQQPLATITASEIALTPAWATMQRQLMSSMEEAALVAVEKYARKSGLVYHVHDVDDAYESRSMRGRFYAIGASEKMLEVSIKEWDALTRFYDDGVEQPAGMPPNAMYMPQLHNEWWNLAVPYNSDAFHMGEGSQYFYDFGLADPTNSEMIRRARRFAGMYMGEDPEAPNYDAEHKIIRSPFHGSEGPLLHAKSKYRLSHSTGDTTGDLELVAAWLDQPGHGGFFHRNRPDGVPSGKARISPLYPIVKDLDPYWYQDETYREKILKLFDDVVLNGDEPSNLAMTGLVTNAYLYTGDDKYKNWVTEYVEAWMDRIKQNDGIIPDNIGPNGIIGENREGQWWGGIHGWNRLYFTPGLRILIGLTIAAECAQLVTGDYGYLELLRSQIKVMLDRGKKREDGQLVVPTRHGPEGWGEYVPMQLEALIKLYHASMAPEDLEMLRYVCDNEVERDFTEVKSHGDRGGATLEARFQYYEGNNPDWATKLMAAEQLYVNAQHENMRRDNRTVEEIIEENRWPANPVVVKGLTQLTQGSPQSAYNGGLARHTVRYFDTDRVRPGLPEDVAAFVDELKADAVGIQLVNTGSQARNLIVQAGAFGEHKFTSVKYVEHDNELLDHHAGKWLNSPTNPAAREVAADGKHFAVQLPPFTSVRLASGMERFVNKPSYAFPWHGASVPVE